MRFSWDSFKGYLLERYYVKFVILLYPLVIENNFCRGLLWVMVNADCIVRRFPDIQKYFAIISTPAWARKWAPSCKEDIHGLTVETHIEEYRKEFPDRESLVIRNADFIDERDFYQVGVEKEYDIFFNSVLLRYKRHELFISTLYDLRNNYRQNVKAAVILWAGHPRPESSLVYSRLYYRIVAFLLQIRRMTYTRQIRKLYEKAIADGLHITLIEPMARWEKDTIEKLRLLYNSSKMYVLLSKSEGVNRAAKEAILCNIPIVVLRDSPTAIALVNDSTGKAVADMQKDVSKGIFDMLDHYRSYSPREWALAHCPRTKACTELWETLNAIQRYPGYPDIEAASKIRQRFTQNQYDNYLDLNHWKGFGTRGSLKNEMQIIRQRFGKFV